jgi:lipopolysaccharide transport system ATP-binding protein
LEPEILIIDEVLAVGDAEFQKKCLGKMEDVSKSGRTILFVSHQLGVVSQLCRKTILLKEGEIVGVGNTLDIVYRYNLSYHQSTGFVRTQQKKTDIFFKSIQLLDRSGVSQYSFLHYEEIILALTIVSKKYHSTVFLSVAIQNSLGRKVFTTERSLEQFYKPGEIKLRVELPRQFLAPGSYSVYAAIHVPRTNTFDELDRICDFTIADGGSEFAKYEGAWFYGDVFADCKWSLIK